MNGMQSFSNGDAEFHREERKKLAPTSENIDTQNVTRVYTETELKILSIMDRYYGCISNNPREIDKRVAEFMSLANKLNIDKVKVLSIGYGEGTTGGEKICLPEQELKTHKPTYIERIISWFL